MKTNTARLQRWLDRLTAACNSSKWKSAVAEADCLSAELKQMREELWLQAEEQKEEPVFIRLKNYAMFSGRSFGIAMIIVCLCSFPIAMESGSISMSASVPTGAGSKFEELALVTTEEKELLQMLRTNLNDSGMTVKAAVKKTPEPPVKKTFTAKTSQPVPQAKVQTAKSAPAAKTETKKSIKAEDILTLVQIGEKSLRGGDSAVKIVN